MDNKLTPKTINHLFCEKCDFRCTKTGDFNRHVLTVKHKRITSGSITSTNKKFNCECGKTYNFASGLSKHKSKHKIDQSTHSNVLPSLGNEGIIDQTLILNIVLQNKDIIQQNKELVQKNSELQSDMMDILKKGTTNISNNNTFNLQFFLNDTCKDAMNITDFVESIKIQLKDLDNIGKNGFVTGITDIIVKELQSIDVTMRPVHCSDAKRETMYVRDADKWEKEDDDKNKLHKMIDNLSHKNLNKLSEWKEAHPMCGDSSSFQSDQYNNIVLGSLDNSKENNNKIIKCIAKEVKI